MTRTRERELIKPLNFQGLLSDNINCTTVFNSNRRRPQIDAALETQNINRRRPRIDAASMVRRLFEEIMICNNY